MHLASAKTIKYLCKKYRVWPSRSSGQNFLVSSAALNTIVNAAVIKRTDTVLEIGAGFGVLTGQLAQQAGRVVAVEMDKRLIKALQKLSVVYNNLEIIHGDIVSQRRNIQALADLQYIIVANLPYNITSLVLRTFLEFPPRPSRMTVLVQKEVAERVVAAPGAMSLLSVAVQFFGSPSIASKVSREKFWPKPNVDSAVLTITDIGRDVHGYQKALGGIDIKRFFSIVRIGFSAKRKQLHNNLSAGLRLDTKTVTEIMEKTGISAAARAQELSIQQWVTLVKRIEKIR